MTRHFEKYPECPGDEVEVYTRRSESWETKVSSFQQNKMASEKTPVERDHEKTFSDWSGGGLCVGKGMQDLS